jgi:SAM-dependent methyltransferase
MLKKLNSLLQNEIDPAYAKRSAYIFSAVENKKPSVILDAGCGRGFYVKALSLYPFVKQIHGIDINNRYVEKAKKLCAGDRKIHIRQGSIYKLPYKDQIFDCVISSEIFEHLDNEKKALSELYRVLKPNGILLITVPNERFPFLWDPINWILMRVFNTHVNKDIWWLAGMWADHIRLYKKDSLTELVNNKFSVTDTKEFIHWSWPLTHFFLYGIGKNIVEKFPSKNFNRFEFTQDKPLSRLLAGFVALPSILFDKRFPTNSSVDIALTAVKSPIKKRR